VWACTFELDADETRAVAVGSLLRADLGIDRPGVAPVHFHIEREHDALWIVPAYGAKDIRVNAAKLTGPKRLDGQAVIEFSNVRIDARILDEASSEHQTLRFAAMHLEPMPRNPTAIVRPFT